MKLIHLHEYIDVAIVGVIDDIFQMFGKLLCLEMVDVVLAIDFLIQVLVGDVVLKIHMQDGESVESKLRDLVDQFFELGLFLFEPFMIDPRLFKQVVADRRQVKQLPQLGIHPHGKFGSHFHADLPKVFSQLKLLG